MSALKIGDNEYGGLRNPLQGLLLIKEVLQQYFGPLWTNFNPQCPLCNKALQDFTKNMHKSVGVCANTDCGAEIHSYDYFGKIMDVIRMVEEEFGPLDEICKKKLTLEADKPAQKKAGKTAKKNTSETTATVVANNAGEKSADELIFEY